MKGGEKGVPFRAPEAVFVNDVSLNVERRVCVLRVLQSPDVICGVSVRARKDTRERLANDRLRHLCLIMVGSLVTRRRETAAHLYGLFCENCRTTRTSSCGGPSLYVCHNDAAWLLCVVDGRFS